MVTIRPDDYDVKSNANIKSNDVAPTKTVKNQPNVMPKASSEQLPVNDVAEITNENVLVHPEDVQRSIQSQQNKALTMREDAELEACKDRLQNAIANGDTFAQAEALDDIAKIENNRLSSLDRNSDSTRKIYDVVVQSLRGADVSEELEELTPKEKKTYNNVRTYLSKISSENRGKTPLKLVLFLVKQGQGDYANYTPQSARNLVEKRMFKEAVQDAPIIALELKEFLPSKERAEAVQHHNRTSFARDAAKDLAGFDPETGRHIQN